MDETNALELLKSVGFTSGVLNARSFIERRLALVVGGSSIDDVDILLLDEPTNHLDKSEWLVAFSRRRGRAA